MVFDGAASTEMTLVPCTPFGAEKKIAADASVRPEDSDSSYQGAAYLGVREAGTVTCNVEGPNLLVRNKVVHEEEASGVFACRRETSEAVVVVAVAAEDSVLFARSVCQGVPIPEEGPEEGLHAVAAVDLHYYTSIRVVEVPEEVHHVASVAAAAGCTEEARHTENVRREEVHEKGTLGGDDNTAELRTRSTASRRVSAIPCVLRLRRSWSSICR
jgi:hypothetical protein